MENMEKVETFYRKNDIGVNIEYTVIGFYKVNGNYMIYTDFTTDHTNKLGIKIYVDKEINNEYVPVSEEERKNIIIAFNKEVTSNRGN